MSVSLILTRLFYVSAAHHEGTYQIYKNVSDCPMYNTIAAQHAQQLVAAGVDFIVVDMTSARLPWQQKLMHYARSVLTS